MFKSVLKKILAPLPMLLMLGIIFVFSSQQGETSSSVSNPIAEFIGGVITKVFNKNASVENGDFLQNISFYVRKLAHITEFLILTLLTYIPVREFSIKDRFIVATERSAFALARMKKGGYHTNRNDLLDFGPRVVITAAAGVFFAALDEFHQSFVFERTGSPMDVLVDSIGIIIAVLLIVIIHHRKSKYKYMQV